MAAQESPSQILLMVLGQGKVRIRHDDYVNVLDLEQYSTSHEKLKKSWARFWIQEIDVMRGLARHHGVNIQGLIQVEIAADGERLIWGHFDLALEYAAYIDPVLRADMVVTYRRVRMGDITLAAEIVNQAGGTDESFQWFRARQELRRHTPIRNQAIKQHSGAGSIYSYCADELNKATTGHTKDEICTIARVRETRDALDTSHLALQLLGESEQIKEMDRRNSQGNNEIK